ncbi:MAG: UDP-3-O-(3-hydroxymyristoyl)glucosamine N-acyltransferase, partial [Gemmatimonadaceae bacterium]|nr:UDP-3-O-(3-hydroxymyristoyl)glucosamine N-acyltransferase [Chitinophagaceae bacterium]
GVTLWGQVGVNKTLKINNNAVVYAQSGVPGDLEEGKVYFGSPCIEARDKIKELVWVKRIPEIYKKVFDKDEGE